MNACENYIMYMGVIIALTYSDPSDPSRRVIG